MGEKKDHLSGELSVSVQLEETGLTAKAKSRAMVALDRLVGNVIDIPSAWLEEVSRRIRRQSEARDQLAEAAGRAAVDMFLRDQERKHRNREAVGLKTVEELKQLPPPAPSEAKPTEDEPISEDWLNVFSERAENATSDHMRALWAQILAGEIRRPGSFSLTTLRAASELDKDIAALFQRKIVDRLPDGFLPKPEDLADQELLDLAFLEEVGLLQEVSGTLRRGIPKHVDGKSYFLNGGYLLIITSANPIQLPIIRITRAGREIASILPREPDDRALRAVARVLRPDVQHIELRRVIRRTSEKIDFEPVGEKLV
jgi:Protein of unknown function (DUF2806)